MKHPKPLARALQFAGLVTCLSTLLAACGGGDDDPQPAAATLTGTAATGAALAGATVAITDADGPVCKEAPIVTKEDGSFTCSLQAGKSAPFLVVVTDPSGGSSPLVSVATRTPAPGAAQTVNATPLTTAIVGQLAPDGSALTVAGDWALLDPAALADISGNVLGQLAQVLDALELPDGYDPFSTPIEAATAGNPGNAADNLLELLRITVVDGVPHIGTIDDPEGAVPLAKVSGAATVLPAPATGALTLAQSVQLLSSALQACFQVPSAARVLAEDVTIPAAQGGQEVTEVADACTDITHQDYLHNGYRAGQAFRSLLKDPDMDGATFVSEVLWFIAGPSGQDRAVVNIRYRDQNGVAGNVLTVAMKLPGSAQTSGRATDWWLYGNQHAVDTSIRAYVRRNRQLAPGGGSGSGPFGSASFSRYETGLVVFVNQQGPGSNGLRAARVKGPGLPSAGLVLTRPDPALCTEQTWLNIKSKDGNTDPAVATPAGNTSNVFVVHRTAGIGSADASTVRANPNAGNANNTQFVNWAHPLDYGLPPGSTGYIDFTQLKAMTSYQFELFYEGESSPRHTYTKTLLTPVSPATAAAVLQWIDLDDSSLQYLDPSTARAAATDTVALGWLANPYAETIASAGVYTWANGEVVNQGLVSVPRGATSAAAAAPTGAACAGGEQFPALTNDGNSGRSFQLRYRMLDGSYKDSMTRFN